MHNPPLANKIREFTPLTNELKKYYLQIPVNPATDPSRVSVSIWRSEFLKPVATIPEKFDQNLEWVILRNAILKNEAWPKWPKKHIALLFDLERDIDEQCESAKELLKKMGWEENKEDKRRGRDFSPQKLWDALNCWQLRRQEKQDSNIRDILNLSNRNFRNPLGYVNQRVTAADKFIEGDYFNILKKLEN